MKKKLFPIINVVLLIVIVFLVKTVYADLKSESNTVNTRVGNPPLIVGSDSEVLKWATTITQKLELGVGRTYSRMLADISNNGYSATKRTNTINQGVGPNGNYWCTYLTIDSYNLAGTRGMNVDSLGAVVNLIGYWKVTPGYLYLDFLNGNHTEILNQVKPGYAMFMQVTPGVFGHLDHTAIVKSININSHGDGELVTINSNCEIIEMKYTFVNGREVNSWTVAPIVGFGTVK